MLPVGERTRFFQHGIQQRRQRHDFILLTGGFQRREEEQIVNQVAHPLAMFQRHAQIAQTVFRRNCPVAIEQRFQKAAYHGQRRAQLVRDIGDKIAAHRFQFFQLRHVARNHQFQPPAKAHHLHLQAQMRHARRVKHQRRRTGLVRQFNLAQQAFIAHQRQQGHTHILAHFQPEMVRRALVHRLDAIQPRERDDARRQGFAGFAKANQGAVEPRALLAPLMRLLVQLRKQPPPHA